MPCGGAILSSITAGWTLYRDLRDRAKVKLSADLRRIAPGGEGKLLSVRPDLNIEGASRDLYIVVTAVNVGRRPKRWEGLGGYYYRPVNGKKGFTITTRGLPKLLGEMEAHTELAEFTGQFANGNVRRLQIWDGAGGEWSVPRREIKKIADDPKSSKRGTTASDRCPLRRQYNTRVLIVPGTSSIRRFSPMVTSPSSASMSITT